MIDTPTAPVQMRKAGLATVRCALCKHPVAHYTMVTGAKAGGLCTREECRVGRDGKRREVYTFEVVGDSL